MADHWRDPDERRRQQKRERYHEQHYGMGGGYGQSRNSLGFRGPGNRRDRYYDVDRPDDDGARQYQGGRTDFTGTYDGGRFDYSVDHGEAGSRRDYGQRDDYRPYRPRPIGHTGRGPRAYKRSDQRILEDVSDRLMEDDELDATDIEVSVDSAEVTLNGSVDSRSDKYRAEDLAEAVSGVGRVQNNLRIQRTSQNTSPLTLNETGIAASPGRYR